MLLRPHPWPSPPGARQWPLPATVPLQASSRRPQEGPGKETPMGVSFAFRRAENSVRELAQEFW